MKLPLLAAASFLVALAGSAGLKIATYQPPPPPESEPHADSVATHDSTPVRDHVDSTTHEAARPAPQLAARVPSTPVAPPARPDSQSDAVDSFQNLARIFSAMQAADAAAVLTHLSDAEIVGIVSRLNARQAAALLAGLPTERAARVTRRLIQLPAAEPR